MDYTKQLKSDLLKSWDDCPPERDDAYQDGGRDVGQELKEFLFLSAITKLRGSIDVYKKSITLTYEFDCKEDALDIAGYLKKFTDGDVFFVFDGAKGEDAFKLQIKDRFANDLLKRMSLSHFDGENFVCDDGIKYLKSTLKDGKFLWYFKGVLYSAAKLQFPDESYSNYCLHLTFSDVAYCEAIADVLSKLDIYTQSSQRKSAVTLQSRNCSDIADILALGVAVGSVLELNSIIAKRESDNEFNRQCNFYVANYRKTVDVAKKYIEAIEKLEHSGKLEKTDAKLKAIAKARKENNDASMQELAQILGISKTSLSRYLGKLLKMAEED